MPIVVSAEGRRFMPYLSHIGWLDSSLGISMFWSDKIIVVLLYLQRLALLLLWKLDWPVFFYRRMNFMYGLLLDFSAFHQHVDPLGKGTIFEGCETICKIVWPLFCLPILLTWACITLHRTMPLYYTRNIERITWTLVRIGLVPFMNTMVRYFILNQNGNLETLDNFWFTPTSEIGTFLVIVTFALFVYLGYKRSSRQILFRSRIRHEAFVRAREIEYKLRFSPTYRNERIWMISSYNYAAWPWSIIRGVVDVLILMVLNFVPEERNLYGIICVSVIFFFNFVYGFIFVDLYRCWSTNVVEHLLNFAIFIFSVFGALQAAGVRSPLLVDRNLDYFLFAIHGSAIAIVVVLFIYFFIDSHKFGKSLADVRAQRKWEMTFGKARGGYVEMGSVRHDDKDKDSDDEEIEREAFVKASKKAAAEEEAKADKFYIPKESTFFSLNCESPHVWPVNGVVINELLRRNTEDHLVDQLRAARRMLDRISALHNTAVLIPIDELKSQIARLQNCVEKCKRSRVTHHLNAIHPLQATFEDMIEQFTFELRVFSGRSITVGHNARKMIEVSRYLRKRMQKRDRALALVSPLMRRVLIKLFALRVFIQLVEERPDFLLPAKPTDGFEGKGAEDIFDGGSSNSDDSEVVGPHGPNAFDLGHEGNHFDDLHSAAGSPMARGRNNNNNTGLDEAEEEEDYAQRLAAAAAHAVEAKHQNHRQ